jgi:uncharacterized protein
MNVVLDTNILLASIGKSSPYRKVFDAFLSYQFTQLLSNDVLLEYLEVIQRKTNLFVAENIITQSRKYFGA